jgi:uncharacterized membrane protein YqaE (UPF0057 family)
MRYILAILLPPIAVLSCGKILQAVVNLLLCLFFWVPGAVHALFVVHDYKANQRADRVIRALRESRQAYVPWSA